MDVTQMFRKTATFLWVFYALAVNAKWQEAIRQEIDEARSNNHLDELDYDRLPSLNAIIKVHYSFYLIILLHFLTPCY